MTKAFKCDFCGDYYERDPTLELYEKQVVDRQGTDYIKVADVCDACHGERFVE